LSFKKESECYTNVPCEKQELGLESVKGIFINSKEGVTRGVDNDTAKNLSEVGGSVLLRSLQTKRCCCKSYTGILQ
jgi:hypothetical protein